MRMKFFLSNVVLVFVFLFSFAAFGESFSIKMKVNVIEKGCDVYGVDGKGFPITVDFKTINYNDVTNPRYEKEVIYNLDCGSENINNPKLKLTFESESAKFSDNLIATSNNTLGLMMQVNGELLSPYKSFSFNYSNKPVIIVKPVVNSNAEPLYGEFYASGVLYVDYE